MSEAANIARARTVTQTIGLIAGPSLFAAMLLAGPPAGMPLDAWRTAALGVLMAIWWVTEALPIAATALLPLLILPMAGVQSLKTASEAYMNPVVILLLAGFIIAKAIERWNLHERIALSVVRAAGVRPRRLLAGFMIAATLLSMWISNTATALMMTPIALSVATSVGAGAGVRDGNRFRIALILAVAYACSIGGLATPVGSPTNLIVIGYLGEIGIDLSFGDWMKLGVPVVLLMTPLAWGVLCAYGARGASAEGDAVRRAVTSRLQALGAITAPETRTMIVFAAVALCWMFGQPLRSLPGLAAFDDQVIAVLGAIAFFAIPSGVREAPSAPLLDWETAERLPWSVVLLFGGGLSLAGAIATSGLAEQMAGAFVSLDALPTVVLVLALTAFVLMLTEFTSNVAAASALMPMTGALAIAIGADPLLLAAPVGLAASCAFMLPMATGPNAVAYATGYVSIGQMARIGALINLLAVIAITVVIMTVGAGAPSQG